MRSIGDRVTEMPHDDQPAIDLALVTSPGRGTAAAVGWRRAWRAVVLIVIPAGLAVLAVAGALATYRAVLAAEGDGTKGYFVSVRGTQGDFRLPDGRITRRHVTFADPASRLRRGAVIPALDTGDASNVFARHGSRYWETDASILAVVLAASGAWIVLVPVRSRRRRAVPVPGARPGAGRRRPRPAAAAAGLRPDWTTAAIAMLNGDVSTRRVNAALRRAADRAAYPILVTVGMPLTDSDRAASPVSGESGRLAELTRTLAGLVGDRGVLAATLADSQGWAFLIYTGSTGWLPGFRDAVRSAAADHLVGLTARPDRHWRVYRDLSRFSPRPLRDRIVLPTVVPLTLAFLAARYGAVSAAGTFLAVEAWILPLALVRRERTVAAQLAHPAAVFPLLCGVWLTLLYPLGAALVHPAAPWICAAGAAAVAIAITAAMWPAQLRYYARLRAQRALPPPGAGARSPGGPADLGADVPDFLGGQPGGPGGRPGG